MAIIPRTTQRQVLPDASALRAPMGDFTSTSSIMGRALRQVGDEISGSMDAMVKAQAIVTAREEDRIHTEQDTAFARYVNDLAYGDGTPENPGFMNLQGVKAADSVRDTVEALTQAKVEALNDERVKKQSKRFQERLGFALDARIDEATKQFADHSYDQGKIAEKGAIGARVSQATDDAVKAYGRDATVFGNRLALIDSELRKLGELEGWSPEVLSEGLKGAQEGIALGVINDALSVEATGKAVAVFRKYKDVITAENAAKIKGEIKRINDKHVAELRDDVSDAIGILSMGKTPANLDQLQAATKGTKYGQALSEAVNDKKIIEDFTHYNLTDQSNVLKALTLKQEFTPEEARRYKGMMQAHNFILERLRNNDGLALAQELGVIDAPAPVDYSNPDTLKARKRQAELAGAHFGTSVSPLSPSELNGIAADLEGANANRTAAILGSLHEGFGDMAIELAGALTKGKRPELGAAMLLAGEGPDGMQTAIDIVQGGRQSRELNSTLEMPVTEKRSVVSDVVGDMFEGTDAEPLTEFIAAADALYASRRAPTGELTFDSETYKQALTDAMGGIVSFNGKEVIPPKLGMDESNFRSLVRGLTDQDLTAFSVGGGSPVVGSGDAFPSSMFSRSGPLNVFGAEAQLQSVGQGIYRVLIPGLGYVTDAKDGSPYEIDLRQAMTAKGIQ